MIIYRNHWAAEDSVESCLRSIRALAFGYDGETTANGLKALIDELSELAYKGLEFLSENKIHTEIKHINEDLQIGG